MKREQRERAPEAANVRVRGDRLTHQCGGCGRWFRGERGLRSHQSRKHNAMGCRPA